MKPSAAWKTRCGLSWFDLRDLYERQLKEFQEAYCEALLELRARESWPLCSVKTTNCRRGSTWITSGLHLCVLNQVVSQVRGFVVYLLLPQYQGCTEVVCAFGRVSHGDN